MALDRLPRKHRDCARLCCKRWSALVVPRPYFLRKIGNITLEQAAMLAKLPSLKVLAVVTCTSVYAIALIGQLTELRISYLVE